MADDRQTAMAELEKDGWSIEPNGAMYVATHPKATAAVTLGGRAGWTLRRIRRDAARALGRPLPSKNRRRAERDFREGEAKRAERAEQNALAARIRAERCRPAAQPEARASAALLEHAARVGAQPGWRASEHAHARMTERGITRLQVLDALRHPRDVSLDGHHPVYAGCGVLVVVDAIDLVVVTVYRGTLAEHRERMPKTTSEARA